LNVERSRTPPWRFGFAQRPAGRRLVSTLNPQYPNTLKMPYQQVLEYLFAQLPMYDRIGGPAFKKDLTNTKALLNFLGNPQNQYPTIHVGGTNGKGSTSHMLSSILQANGMKAGLYISPHYRDIRERIKVNGQYIPRKNLVEFVEKMKPIIAEIQPSFFELMVAMAFDHFAKVKVDVAVIEVGLGGRLDSTNVITPELSIITNISFDHMQFLGNTLTSIAGEKAGIIKPKVPAVIGETNVESAPVFIEKAQQEQAAIFFADQHYQAKMVKEDLQNTYYDVYHDGQLRFESLPVNLHANYQAFNLQTVLQAVDCLPKAWNISEEAVKYGLENLVASTRFIGRWQILSQEPTIIADSAHNEAGLELAMKELDKIPHKQLHLVIGVLKDKDLSKMLPLLPTDGVYYFAKPNIPRGMDAAELQQAALESGRKGKVYSSVKNAYKAARRHAQPEDVVYVGGSIFVLAEII